MFTDRKDLQLGLEEPGPLLEGGGGDVAFKSTDLCVSETSRRQALALCYDPVSWGGEIVMVLPELMGLGKEHRFRGAIDRRLELNSAMEG